MNAVFTVEDAGLLTTIQDLGRPYAIGSGVPPGGAMDRFAHIAANRIVGNDPSAATLECTVRGPRLRATAPCLVAVTGADFELRLNESEVPTWSGVSIAAGDVLAFGERRRGGRAYVAVAGGFSGDRWLGSQSTDLLVEHGGMHGRPLRSGDVLATAGPTPEPLIVTRQVAADARPDYSDHTLRVVAGPHSGRLPAASHDALYAAAFTVGVSSNRMGFRLEGPRLEAPGPELLSFGVVAGAIQLPSGGGPILLMADHQTAGGYPVVAVVAAASMPVAAQLLPGDELRLQAVDIEAALRLRADQRALLASIR